MKEKLIELQQRIRAHRVDLDKQRKFGACTALSWCLVQMDALGLLIVEPQPEPIPAVELDEPETST